jgi:hypothetical protein
MQREMTISGILDHIKDMTDRARILRINKIDLDNGKKYPLADNSFKDLKKYPDFRDKETIMKILEDTALKSEKKSSLEWIWGKSPSGDAYYSTKLTYFDDHFSLYPEYRFYIGDDPFRDRNSWFFTLEVHPKVQQQEIFAQETVIERKEEVREVETGEVQTVTEIQIERAEENFDCGCAEEVPDFQIETVHYENRGDSLVPAIRTVSAEELLKTAYSDKNFKFIRLTGTDFSFEGVEVKKTESESVIEIGGDAGLCANRLKKHLSEGMTEPNVKRTAELIYSKDKNGMSYYAAVITVYDGQATFFTEYKIYASSEVRKDKNSWFNKL